MKSSNNNPQSLILKEFWVAKSKGGKIFLIKKVDKNATLFPIWACIVQPEKNTAVDPTAMSNYSFDAEGFYFADRSDHENNLIESRPLKHGEMFRIAHNGKLMEYLDIHDLKGLFEVIEHHKSGIDKFGWDTPK